ncbi:MAG TPA: DUF1499 domain-containing protein, partial [Planctomycetia bacterium]|nr:DUF1499 domain-containing protein [Planctomycetia bacterium]
IVALAILSLLARKPNLGVENGKLKFCPHSPNCVCSHESPDARQFIEAIKYEGDATAAYGRLKALVESMPRTTVIEAKDGYLRCECRTAVFGFVDDMEFLVDEKANSIQVRAAARSGYSDMGANRKRVENLRGVFQAKTPPG